jgi:hypothetical protein
MVAQAMKFARQVGQYDVGSAIAYLCHHGQAPFPENIH